MGVLILLLPLTTICVALVGFYVWHRQLVRKRHFEIADAALSAFCRAETAVAHAREPTTVDGEGSSRKRRDDESPACSEMLDTLYIPLERLKHYGDAFEELERAAINAEVHFSSDVAHHLREPLRAYNRIATAVICRMSCVGLSDPARVSATLVRRWETVVLSGGRREVDSADQLSVEMDRAKWSVEAALRPYVEAPTFGEFLLHGLRAWTRRSIAHLASLLSRRRRYGMIPVYAEHPRSGADLRFREPTRSH